MTQSQLQFVYELSLWFKEHAMSGKSITPDAISWRDASNTLKQILEETPMSTPVRRKKINAQAAAEAARDDKPPKLRAIEL